MVEAKVRKQIGWDENKFLKHDVSATSILDKEMEDYLFNNDAKKQFCKQLKNGVSSDSIDKLFNRSPSNNQYTDLKPQGSSGLMMEWIPQKIVGTSTARKPFNEAELEYGNKEKLNFENPLSKSTAAEEMMNNQKIVKALPSAFKE